MSACEVCGAQNRTCGHQRLVLPVVDLAPRSGGVMGKRERPILVRQHLPANRGRAGWLNATVIEQGTEGIPLVPEPEDVEILPEPIPEPPASSVFVDGADFAAPPEPAPKTTRRKDR